MKKTKKNKTTKFRKCTSKTSVSKPCYAIYHYLDYKYIKECDTKDCYLKKSTPCWETCNMGKCSIYYKILQLIKDK